MCPSASKLWTQTNPNFRSTILESMRACVFRADPVDHLTMLKTSRPLADNDTRLLDGRHAGVKSKDYDTPLVPPSLIIGRNELSD